MLWFFKCSCSSGRFSMILNIFSLDYLLPTYTSFTYTLPTPYPLPTYAPYLLPTPLPTTHLCYYLDYLILSCPSGFIISLQ